MAILEVHDDQGQVRRVTISRAQPVLFGSSDKCDVVLGGPGVLPFHGRLRWKVDRFKVDASPDAEYVEVNGQRMASSSFRQGDEVAVGQCRIFMLLDDDDLPQDDKTRIQPPPRVEPVRTVAPKPVAPQRPSSSRPARSTKPGRSLERDDWLGDLDVAPPSVETPLSSIRSEASAAAVPAISVKDRRPGGWRGFVQFFSARSVAPGQERIVSSPLVLGLVITFVALVCLGFMLHQIIAESVATKLYRTAMENLEDGDYANAMRRFDEFLAREPSDEKTKSKAKVSRAVANVRQFASATRPSWSNALEAERAMLETVGSEPEYRDASTELAELVLKTGEGLADRAKAVADGKALAEAESAVALHARVAGKPASELLARSQLPAKLADARAAVLKFRTRAAAFAAMDAALKAGTAAGVYSARDGLVRLYADLAEDRELVERMTRANDLVRKGVTFDESRKPAETGPRQEPTGPLTSLILRSAPTPPPAANATPGTVVFALADGIGYAVDGGSGAPLWQKLLGLSAPFAPRMVPGGSTALAFDARYHELLRVDARKGTVVWRQELGESVGDAPLILGNQVLQTTPSGKLIIIDLQSGEIQGTLNLGMPVSHAAVGDESGQYLYLVADRDCLFTLSRDPLACVAVDYIGHSAGSIPCPPARLGRFLVIAENHTSNESRWRVGVLEDGGARFKPVQKIVLPGWTWGTPASAGSVVWAIDDRGGTTAFAMGSYEADKPFTPIVRIDPEAKLLGPTFAVARSERELWVASARPGRRELDINKGAVANNRAVPDVGPALAPPQVAGPLVVLTQQRVGQPGVVLVGAQSQTGDVRWETVLGAPWFTPPSANGSSDGITTLGMGGQPLSVSRENLAAGGFVETPLPRPIDFRLPAGPIQRLAINGLDVLALGPGSRYLLVRSGKEEYRRVELPVGIGARPLVWGNELFLPGEDGRAYLVDPATGDSRSEPYVPIFNRERTTRWLGPALVEGDAVAISDETGRVRRLTIVREQRPRLVATAEVSLGQPVASDPVSTGSALVIATTDGRVRALAARDLSAVGSWPLGGALARPLAGGPGWAVAADRSGGLLALGADGQKLWNTAASEPLADWSPVVQDQAAYLFAQDGSLLRISMKDGTTLGRLPLELSPTGAPIIVGEDLVLPVASGSVQLLDRRASEDAFR